MPWNCFIAVCGTAEESVLRPAMAEGMETLLRESITAAWGVVLGMSKSGELKS